MALPSPYTIRSYAGAATPTYLTAALSGVAASGQVISVANTSDWYEVTVSGTLSSNPLGTSGPFTLVVDYGTATEEKVLCSGVVAISATGTNIPVWFDSTSSGRAYDGTAIQAHASGTVSNLNVFPVMSASEVVGFNMASSNPFPGIKPGFHNLKAWTWDPGLFTGTAVQLGGGPVNFTAIDIPYPTVISGIVGFIGVSGSGSVGNLGIYNSTTLLGSTGTTVGSAFFNAATNTTVTGLLQTPVNITVPGTYWIGYYITTASGMQMYRSSASLFQNFNITAVSGSLTHRNSTFSSNALPTTITGTPAAVTTNNFLFGLI